MPNVIREIVAAFDTPEALDNAVFALETEGFDRAAFSVLATEETVNSVLGHRYEQVKEVEDDPQVPRETFFSRMSRLEAEAFPVPVLASLGWLTVAGIGGPITAVIAAGAGGLIGAVLSGLIHHHHAARVQEQLARGGLVLWVSLRDAAAEEKALRILQEQGAHDLHAHSVPVQA
ncbi:MAG: hypothetical protein P4L52_05750 [Acidocella sp.]|nr:hypothetical protein [Acidocella sp.]